jgi:hypothetical protein
MGEDRCTHRHFFAHQGERCSKERHHADCPRRGEWVQCIPIDLGREDGPWFACEHVPPGYTGEAPAPFSADTNYHAHPGPLCHNIAPNYHDPSCDTVHHAVDDTCSKVQQGNSFYALCAYPPA